MFLIYDGRLQWLHIAVAAAVCCCYWLAGLYSVWHDFHWVGVVGFGLMHVVAFLAVQKATVISENSVLCFVSFVAVGVLVFAVSWMGLPATNHGFPLALAGSMAWSMVSWESTAFRAIARGRRWRIRRADQFLVLTAPLIMMGILGAIYAVTNPDSRLVTDRIEDFWNVAQLGVACGLLFWIPWFCIALIGKER